LIPSVKEVRDYIAKNINLDERHDVINCHSFVSFVGESESFNYHSDEWDIFIWQVIGSTKWNVRGEGPSERLTHKLLPNQMIYIPKNTMHKPEIIEPRVSISFGIERDVV